jgi:predicted AAA+ superfamily ATPase
MMNTASLAADFKDHVYFTETLGKVFILYRLDGFSSNLRKEITKNSRYFFHDNGIRNAVINNFNPLGMRNDIGELWENYVVMERMKRNEYLRQDVNTWFWRTYDRHEIYLVEDSRGRLTGYEIKWQQKKVKAPASWTRSYPQAEYHVITRENYLDYIR